MTDKLLELAASHPDAVAANLYNAARWAARGASGARKSAQRRRNRRQANAQRMSVLAGRATPMPTARRALPAPNRPSGMLSAAPTAAPIAYGARLRQDYSGLSNYVVSHSEYVADVNGSSEFSLKSYRINAADNLTFPWLASLAPNFEKYVFRKLTFKLRPQAPSTTGGVIMMAFDYDPTDLAPADKASMLQYDGATRTNSWSEQSMSLKAVSPKFTAQYKPADTADVRLSDAANLFVATSGQGSTDAVSELWAEYTVELRIPQARSTCDAFGLSTNNWDPDVVFQETAVFNPSNNFSVHPTLSSAVTANVSGQYVLVASMLHSSVDITAGEPAVLKVTIDGGAPTQHSTAGPSDVASFQTQLYADVDMGVASPLFIVRGDVVRFGVERTIPSSILSLKFYILPV